MEDRTRAFIPPISLKQIFLQLKVIRRRRQKRGATVEGEGIPSRLGNLGSVVNTPSGVRGGAPAKNEFSAF